jgi:hypothetical protein
VREGEAGVLARGMGISCVHVARQGHGKSSVRAYRVARRIAYDRILPGSSGFIELDAGTELGMLLQILLSEPSSSDRDLS